MRLVGRGKSLCLRSLFGFLLMVALVPLLAARASAGNVRITVNGTITSASAGMGYTAGQAVSFYWDVNDYAPQAPVGQTSSVEHKWTHESAGSEPKLLADVGGTGIGGVFQEGPGGVPWDRVRVRPFGDGSPNNDFEVQMRTDGFDTSTNNRGIYLNSDTSYLIKGVYFDGDINSPFPQSVFPSGGPLPNPTAFLSGYYGTYNVVSQQSGQVDASNGTTDLVARFTATSVSMFAAPQTQPVPEPTSMTIFGLGALGMAYRARRKLKA